jgi:hypothetical protein
MPVNPVTVIGTLTVDPGQPETVPMVEIGAFCAKEACAANTIINSKMYIFFIGMTLRMINKHRAKSLV